MKKIWLLCFLFLFGCDANLPLKEESVIKTSTYEEITSLNHLIKRINDKVKQGQYEFCFQSDENYALDDIVKHLSFLLPFDIKVIKTDFIDYTQIEVICLDETYEDAKEEAKRIIDENIDASYSVDEQIEFVYHYILERCEYDTTITKRNPNNERAFQCAGVIFDGVAVCTGYARTFLLFMNLLDIPCLYLPSDVMNHSFNLVYDETMRYFDLTWDDDTHFYYRKGKASFFEDGKHVFDEFYDDEFFEGFLAAIYL